MNHILRAVARMRRLPWRPPTTVSFWTRLGGRVRGLKGLERGGRRTISGCREGIYRILEEGRLA